MVDEARQMCADILASDGVHRKLINVALHHPSQTAKPVFEIMRALIVDLVKQPERNITVKDRDSFNGVLAEIAAEYFSLLSVRNTLLHGTCFVGYVSSDDPDAE